MTIPEIMAQFILWQHFGHMATFWPNGYTGMAIKRSNEYLCGGVSTVKYTKMKQSGEGIKKIKGLHNKLWPKQITANFPLYFWTFPM